MRLSIVGHARHGKDTVAEMLRDLYGMKFTSSSWFCAEKIMMPAFTKASGLVYSSVKECFDDRVNHRAFWHQKIAEYCEPDLTALGRAIWRTNDIYVGMRSWRELAACKVAGLYDFCIWVDRSKHLPAEPKDSMNIEPWMADYILDNNGTLEQLSMHVNRLMGTLFIRLAHRRSI